MTYVVHQRM